MIGCAALAAAWAGVVAVDRVDVLSEDPGEWLADELPFAAEKSSVVAVRFVEQIKPVLVFPGDAVFVGLSLASQSLVVERPIVGRFGLSGGVSARAFLPRGAMLGAYGRFGRVRLGLSANVLAAATWSRPVYDSWRVVPGVGVGVGRRAW